jgi:toxin-antitoxin system PIN domain toxin
MSITLDANLLVYASNERDPHHRRAMDLIERLAEGPDLVYLFWPAIMAYLRITTHPTILIRPLSITEATENVSALLRRPHVRTEGEPNTFWHYFLESARSDTRGNAVPDAHLVALMRSHGVTTIYTRDRGFRRYEGITVRDPFASDA